MSVSSRASDGGRSSAAPGSSRGSYASRAPQRTGSHHPHGGNSGGDDDEDIEDDDEIFELRCNRCDGPFRGMSDVSILECHCVLCHGCTCEMLGAADTGCPCCGSGVSESHRAQLTTEVTNAGSSSTDDGPSASGGAVDHHAGGGPINVQRAVGHLLRRTAVVRRPDGSYGPGVTHETMVASLLSLMDAVRQAAAILVKQLQLNIAATAARSHEMERAAADKKHEFDAYRKSSEARNDEARAQLEQLELAMQEMQQVIDQEKNEYEEASRYLAAQQETMELQNCSLSGSRSMGSAASPMSHQAYPHHQQLPNPPLLTYHIGTSHHQQLHQHQQYNRPSDGMQQQDDHQQFPQEQQHQQRLNSSQQHHGQAQFHQPQKQPPPHRQRHHEPQQPSTDNAFTSLRRNGYGQPSNPVYGRSAPAAHVRDHSGAHGTAVTAPQPGERVDNPGGIPSVIAILPKMSSNDSISTVGIDLGTGHTGTRISSSTSRHYSEPRSCAQNPREVTARPRGTAGSAPTVNPYLAPSYDAVSASVKPSSHRSAPTATYARAQRSNGSSSMYETSMTMPREDRHSHGSSPYSHVPSHLESSITHGPTHAFSPQSSDRFGAATGAALGHSASLGTSSYAPFGGGGGGEGGDDASLGFGSYFDASPPSLATSVDRLTGPRGGDYRSPGHDDPGPAGDYDDPHFHRVMPPPPPPPVRPQHYRPTDFGDRGDPRVGRPMESLFPKSGSHRASSHPVGDSAGWTSSHDPRHRVQRSTSGRAPSSYHHRR